MVTAAEMRSLAAEKRADAARARRWATSISSPDYKVRLRQVAIELDREADELERQVENSN